MSLGMKEDRSIVHSQSCMKIVYGPGMRIEKHDVKGVLEVVKQP